MLCIISRQAVAGSIFEFSEEWHIKLTLLETGPDETKWLINGLIKNCPNDSGSTILFQTLNIWV